MPMLQILQRRAVEVPTYGRTTQLASLNKAWLNKLAPRGSAEGPADPELYIVQALPYMLDSPVPS